MGLTQTDDHLGSTAATPGAPAPAGASYLTPTKKYKWIAEEIDRLDVATDYARIWSLTTIYYGDDTLVNLLYATGMPNFVQNPFGSDLLVNRTKKAKEQQDSRAWDTLAHFWRWFEYGPDHIDAQRSLETVNRIHVALAKKSPKAFPDEDFIFTTAWLGTYLHRLREMVGVQGFTDKQKAAAHLFWQNITLKMRGPNGYVTEYPESFEAMERFVDEFVARPRPQTDSGRDLGKYVIEQFNRAQLPRPLWPLGRQICLTVQSPEVRHLHRMGEPNPVAEFLIKKALGAKIRLQEKVLPDPRQSTPEKARAVGRTEDQHREPRMVPAAQCPFHAA
jgi:hypothetical protein